MYTDAVFIAFTMTMIAGLSTGFGSLLALLAKKTNTKLISGALGFSAGVMIYVSFVDLLSQANITLVSAMGKRQEAGRRW